LTVEENAWSFSLSAYTYVLPDSHYVQPNVSADRGWLHLEARWNYEELHTGSVWFGYGFTGGKTLEWELTPMIGGVFGDTSGIAPGFKDRCVGRSSSSTARTSTSPTPAIARTASSRLVGVDSGTGGSIRFGLVTQRTRVCTNPTATSSGVIAGFSFDRVDLTGYGP
jgi:hypothetical protein